MRFQFISALFLPLVRIMETVIGIVLSLVFAVVIGYFIDWFLGLFVLIVGLLMVSLGMPEPPQNAAINARSMHSWPVSIMRLLVGASVLGVGTINLFPAGAYVLVIAWFIWAEGWLDYPSLPQPEEDDF